MRRLILLPLLYGGPIICRKHVHPDLINRKGGKGRFGKMGEREKGWRGCFFLLQVFSSPFPPPPPRGRSYVFSLLIMERGGWGALLSLDVVGRRKRKVRSREMYIHTFLNTHTHTQMRKGRYCSQKQNKNKNFLI